MAAVQLFLQGIVRFGILEPSHDLACEAVEGKEGAGGEAVVSKMAWSQRVMRSGWKGAGEMCQRRCQVTIPGFVLQEPIEIRQLVSYGSGINDAVVMRTDEQRGCSGIGAWKNAAHGAVEGVAGL